MTSSDDARWREAGGPPVRCSVTTGRVADLATEAEVREWLADQSGDGWVCCTGEVRPWAGGELPRGVPLSAEIAVRGRDQSLSMLRGGTGWSVWSTTEAPGETHLCFDVVLLSTEPGRRLKYRQYWRPVGSGPADATVGVWRPFAARFVGWELL